MYVYIEMRARFSSIDRFVEKLFAGWIDENEKRKRRNEKRERKKKEKEKEERTKIKWLQSVVRALSVIQQVWLSLTKYEKRVMEFKSEYFFFPFHSFGNFKIQT